MFRARSIDHLNIDVRDLDESCEFYERIFGFKLLEECQGKNGVRNCIIIGTDQIKLCLYEVHDFELGRGLNHFGFDIEDFDAAVERCQESGMVMLYGGIVKWPKSRSIYIEDPNGYEIELSEFAGGAL